MVTTEATVFGTNLSLVMKGSLGEIVCRKMVLLIGYCWFFVTTSLAIFFRFLSRRFLRINGDDSSQQQIMMASTKEERPLEAVISESEETEKETSGFEFKFRFQIPEEGGLRAEEEKARNSTGGVEDVPPSLTMTSISKYRFSSEKGFSGFVEKPEFQTFCVQESYVGSDRIAWNDSERLDTELQTRFLSVKNKNFQQFNSEAGAAVHEEQEEAILSTTEKSVESEPVILFKNQLSGTTSSPEGARFLSEGDFCGFDSESDFDSISVSDGYSVKNLIVDSDSDGFLSEKDFESETTKATCLDIGRENGELLEDSRKSEETCLQNSRNSDPGTSMDFHRVDVNLPEEMGKSMESSLKNLYNSNPESLNSGNSDLRNEAPRERDFRRAAGGELELFHEAEKVLRELEREADYFGGDEEAEPTGSRKFQVTELPNSCTLDEESVDSGDHGLSAFKNNQNSDSKCVYQVPPEKELGILDLELIDSDGEETVKAKQLIHLHNSMQSDEAILKKPEDSQKPEETHLDKSKDELSTEDSEELESLWEHQDLIEQLKMELKKVRAVGLPTILEESESPKSIEDLKPWKIDAKFLHEDPMDELHKFYKSYRERMRKFDILNYQKMYAIGFLQLKDPLQSMGSQKPLIPTITSLLSQNIWPCRRRKSSADPSEKFIKELQTDLETVYAGQLCLSWEFLRWQYEKTRAFPESDPHGGRQYNQVAGEFQQFQVVIQRFIENEPFQGPRIPNYVKNRCVLRNLLQVPVIKEDCLKDKMEQRRKGNNAITSEILEDIMEESIRIFWEFVKADKDETPIIVKGLMGTHVELQDPMDFELMVDIQANLHKKEKKLRDIMRTGNCLVKKFKKPLEGCRSNQDDVFFSQVDLKLVSRVLKMSRITTDQLVWCHKKLIKITFVDRKLLREPSFLLFPC